MKKLITLLSLTLISSLSFASPNWDGDCNGAFLSDALIRINKEHLAPTQRFLYCLYNFPTEKLDPQKSIDEIANLLDNCQIQFSNTSSKYPISALPYAAGFKTDYDYTLLKLILPHLKSKLLPQYAKIQINSALDHAIFWGREFPVSYLFENAYDFIDLFVPLASATKHCRIKILEEILLPLVLELDTPSPYIEHALTTALEKKQQTINEINEYTKKIETVLPTFKNMYTGRIRDRKYNITRLDYIINLLHETLESLS